MTLSPSPPAGRQWAVAAEGADTQAWLDQFDAAPPAVRQMLDLAATHVDGLAMVRSRIPFSHFNMVLTLGCPAHADAAAFERVARFYAEGGVSRHWVLVNDFSQPSTLAEALTAMGYASAGAWDRVTLDGPRPDLWRTHAAGAEVVTATTAEEWADFIVRSYGMPPPIKAWLLALPARAGWHHAIRREGGRAGAPVVMARSLFRARDGWAWLGIDAPVPGVMAPCFDDDRAVSAALLLAAASAGAQRFVTDIEAPAPDRLGPGYRGWADLGFEPVYLRRLFSRG